MNMTIARLRQCWYLVTDSKVIKWTRHRPVRQGHTSPGLAWRAPLLTCVPPEHG